MSNSLITCPFFQVKGGFKNCWMVIQSTSNVNWGLPKMCWIISSMGSSTVRSWLVSTIDSCTIVFVWLLTHLQGASTALAKHESTFVDHILLGLTNSNKMTLSSSFMSSKLWAIQDQDMYISLEEQLAIFLYTSVTGLTVQHVGKRFQQSNATILRWGLLLHTKATYLYYSRYFRWMVQIFSSQPLYTKYICQPTSYNQSSHLLHHKKKLWLFFQHALGAIDGSHIHFLPPAFYQAAYWNWKGFLSQNCLFACSFDLIFTYALTGWEGSAANAWVYHDAVNTDLVIPEGWYYLADAGFPHCDHLLVPFWGVRYHLAEWGQSTTW